MRGAKSMVLVFIRGRIAENERVDFYRSSERVFPGDITQPLLLVETINNQIITECYVNSSVLQNVFQI